MIIKTNKNSNESYKVFTEKDRSEWKTLLPTNFNVFTSVENAELEKKHFGYEPRLFVFQRGEGCVAYPFYFRPVTNSLCRRIFSEGVRDIVSPQYSCGLVYNDLDGELSRHFRTAFHNFCRKENIVTEFAHLHPFECKLELFDKPSVGFDREIVYVDLSFSVEQLWKESFNTNCRKNIRRAKRNGLIISEVKSAQDIREFHRVYTHTMERNNALKKYFYRLEYFSDAWSVLTNNARYSLAIYDNRIVGGLLTFHDSENAFAYLLGTDYDFKTYNMASLLHYDAIKWSRDRGKKRYILGSGYWPSDGLFKFKSGFSPLRVKFYTYKRVHVGDAYNNLTRRWLKYYPNEKKKVDFFPQYYCESMQTPESVVTLLDEEIS